MNTLMRLLFSMAVLLSLAVSSMPGSVAVFTATVSGRTEVSAAAWSSRLVITVETTTEQEFRFVSEGSGLPPFFSLGGADGTYSRSFEGRTEEMTVHLTEPESGWTLTGLNCIDPSGDSSADVSTWSVTVQVAGAETVECVFTGEVSVQ